MDSLSCINWYNGETPVTVDVQGYFSHTEFTTEVQRNKVQKRR